MSWSEILSLVATFLATGIGIWFGIVEYRRYHLPLVMKIHNWQTIWHKDNSVIVLFLLSLVNPSTQGRNVFCIEVGIPQGLTASELQAEYMEDIDWRFYPLPTQSSNRQELDGYHVRASRILEAPLDILQNQSVSGYVAFSLVIPSLVDSASQQKSICILFRAKDIRDKQIACCKVDVTITDLLDYKHH